MPRPIARQAQRLLQPVERSNTVIGWGPVSFRGGSDGPVVDLRLQPAR
jgi:hypothetical protein